jgi:cytochrome c-type biogenesis protein CcmE
MSARRQLPWLPSPTLALRCHVPWDSMQGDARVRSCARCNKPVFNLSALTTEQALELLADDSAECVRFYERPDGTIVTSDCPMDVRARRVRTAVRVGALGLAAAAAWGIVEASRPIPVVTVDELARHRELSGPVRVEGVLVHGSLEKAPGGFRFEMKHGGDVLEVQHMQEVVPDTFRDTPITEVSVLVEGVLDEHGVFKSTALIAKAPSGERFRASAEPSSEPSSQEPVPEAP